MIQGINCLNSALFGTRHYITYAELGISCYVVVLICRVHVFLFVSGSSPFSSKQDDDAGRRGEIAFRRGPRIGPRPRRPDERAKGLKQETEHDRDNNSAAPDKAKSGKQKAEIGASVVVPLTIGESAGGRAWRNAES